LSDQLLSVHLFITGLLVVFFQIYKRRLSLVITWPYLLYGAGYLVPFFLLNYHWFAFTATYIVPKNVLIAQATCVLFLFSTLALDYIIMSKVTIDRYFIDKCDDSLREILLNMSQGLGYGAVCIAVALAYCYYMYVTYFGGGGIRDYSAPMGTDPNWRTLGALSEVIILLFSLYCFPRVFFRNNAFRNYFYEIAFLLFFTTRLYFGTRLFAFKMLAAMAIVLYIQKRIKAIHILIGSSILIVVMSFIGIERMNNKYSGSMIENGSGYIMESYFVDLSHIICTENLWLNYDQPDFPFSVMMNVVPKQIYNAEKNEVGMFNPELFANKIGVDSVQPLGGYSLFAQPLMAYGQFFFVPILIVVLCFLFYFKNSKSQLTPFWLFMVSALMLNFWRDSWHITCKSLSIYIFFFLVIRLLSPKSATKWRPLPAPFYETRR